MPGGRGGGGQQGRWLGGQLLLYVFSLWSDELGVVRKGSKSSGKWARGMPGALGVRRRGRAGRVGSCCCSIGWGRADV